MSHATRCPQCQTVFSVSQEQLEQFAGTVRCGLCGRTFNGYRYMLGDIPVLTADDAILTPTHNKTLDSDPAPETPAVPVTLSQNVTVAATGAVAAAAATEAEREEQLKTMFDEKLKTISLDITPEAEAKPVIPALSIQAQAQKQATEPARDPLVSVTVAPEKASEPAPEPAKPAPVPEKPTTMAIPVRTSKAQTKRRGSVWPVLGSIALILILLGQLFYFFPDKVEEKVPSLKGLVGSFCATAGCKREVKPPPPVPKAPAPITLFDVKTGKIAPVEGQPGNFLVEVMLKNASQTVQEAPLLEMSVESTKGAVLHTQIFTPRSYISNPNREQRFLNPGEEIKFALPFPCKSTDPFIVQVAPVRK